MFMSVDNFVKSEYSLLNRNWRHKGKMASEISEMMIELAKYHMALRGWRQRNLAQEMGLDEAELSLLLNRKRPWSLKTIEAFKHATGIVVEI